MISVVEEGEPSLVNQAEAVALARGISVTPAREAVAFPVVFGLTTSLRFPPRPEGPSAHLFQVVVASACRDVLVAVSLTVKVVALTEVGAGSDEAIVVPLTIASVELGDTVNAVVDEARSAMEPSDVVEVVAFAREVTMLDMLVDAEDETIVPVPLTSAPELVDSADEALEVEELIPILLVVDHTPLPVGSSTSILVEAADRAVVALIKV
jgi:hypothetical protein